MVNDGLRNRRPSFAIDGARIEQAVRVDKGQADLAAPAFHLAVEAGASAGVAGRAHLLDADPDRVLVAVGAHLDHALGLAGALALPPQRVARAAEVPGFTGGDGLAQR